ncbi:MAG TPA: cytochrome c [Candidatus Elarobacter sp.]|jgi:mono/diheme cytochrome c family protein
MLSKPFVFVVAGAVAVALATGCSKSTDQSQSSTTTTQGSASTTSAAPSSTSGAATTALGDAAHGKQIFSTNCASCHGATGVEGGIGPSLKGEKAKKNYDQTIAWIHDPKPPMPKLWPSPLNDKDVQDVAAYVQTL